MAISFTFHGQRRAADATGAATDGFGKALAARTAVADAAASTALAASGWYRIVASTASYVLIDAAAANGTNGEHWPASHVDWRWIEAGQKIGCSSAA